MTDQMHLWLRAILLAGVIAMCGIGIMLWMREIDIHLSGEQCYERAGE